jgi:hypothetical protein
MTLNSHCSIMSKNQKNVIKNIWLKATQSIVSHSMVYIYQNSFIRATLQEAQTYVHMMQMYKTLDINKVKQSLYSLGQAPRVPGGWGYQILRQLLYEGGKVVRPTHWPPSPPTQEIYLVPIAVRGWVNPRAKVWPEGFCQWKIPMTPSGIKLVPSGL